MTQFDTSGIKVPEERWKVMPDDKKIAVLDTIEHSIELNHKLIDTLKQLKRTLLHGWMKHEEETMSGMIVWTDMKFLKFMRAYHKAVEQGHDGFMFDDHPMVTAYAKYLIEYLEPQMLKATTKMTYDMQVRAEKNRHKKVMDERAAT